jgi:hypothetical protein
MDVVSSGNDGGCRKERRMTWKKCENDMVIVVHSWYRCCAKHPKRTHVKLRDEASLREEEVRRKLILHCQRATFSGDAVECIS